MQIVYYAWLALGLYLVFYVLDVRGRRSLFRSHRAGARRRRLALVVAACLGAVLAAGARLQPAFDPRRRAGGGVGFEYATGWSLGWREILTFVVPSAMGFGGET